MHVLLLQLLGRRRVAVAVVAAAAVAARRAVVLLRVVVAKTHLQRAMQIVLAQLERIVEKAARNIAEYPV
jgi:hypothetical protein